MARELFIDPNQVRSAKQLTSAPIPVNAYVPNLAAERQKIGDASLARIARDIILVREFELMLD